MLQRFLLPLLVLCAALSAGAMPKPPEKALTFVRGNVEYYSGAVYLSAHEDTAKLKALGFRDFSFDSRSFGSVKYRAEWPLSVIELPAPSYLNGMDYDVAAANTADADEPLSLQGSASSRSADAWSGGGAREASQAEEQATLKEMKLVIQCHAQPGNGKPDSVIDGREYVRGYVTLRSLADTLDLVPFGFLGFNPEPNGGQTFDNSHAGLPVVTYSSYHAWWPIDVPVKMLPESVYDLQADRMRRGTHVVVIERKMPTE